MAIPSKQTRQVAGRAARWAPGHEPDRQDARRCGGYSLFHRLDTRTRSSRSALQRATEVAEWEKSFTAVVADSSARLDMICTDGNPGRWLPCRLSCMACRSSAAGLTRPGTCAARPPQPKVTCALRGHERPEPTSGAPAASPPWRFASRNAFGRPRLSVERSGEQRPGPLQSGEPTAQQGVTPVSCLRAGRLRAGHQAQPFFCNLRKGSCTVTNAIGIAYV